MTRLSHDQTAVAKPCSDVFAIRQNLYIASGFPEEAKIAYDGTWSRVAVIHLDLGQDPTVDYLRDTLQTYEAHDDVFCLEFLQGVVFTTSDESHHYRLSPAATDFLKSYHNEWIEFSIDSKQSSRPAPGVFIASHRQLFEVYRLYEDSQQAFMTPVICGPNRTYFPLGLSSEDPGAGLVAVPSRLAQKSDSQSTLSGLRIVVKDNFHVKGIRTSACNRAYYSTYPKCSSTAECIAKLVGRNARLLGTTKLAAFAATEEPLECVDYGAPWNPRGDGHQSPAGSSSGSGVAAASYSWVDIAIGTDTSGSGRRPAHWNGCFALRPSHGVINTKGLLPSFPQFDCPTLFGRNIDKCQTFVKAWYGDMLAKDVSDLPYKIVLPKDYLDLIKNNDQLNLISGFVADLEATLQTKSVMISFEALWNSDPPSGVNGQKYADYMEAAGRHSFFYDDYHNTDSFRADYMKKFSKAPYVSPPVQWQWDLSATFTREQRDEAVHRLAVYKEWVNTNIVELGRLRTIIIIPIENISPRYRDEARTHFNPVGVPMLFLSPILGAPELTVPIGQVPYFSRVSKCEELQPVAISLLSTPGTDLELFTLASKCLKDHQRPTEVATGRVMF